MRTARRVLRESLAIAALVGAAACSGNPAPQTPAQPTLPGDPPTAAPHEILEAQRRARPTGTAAQPGVSDAVVRGHMEFLASDAMNGRASGTRDEWIAATYVASQLRQWGIEPLGDAGSYVQQIDMAPLEAVAAPVLTADVIRITHGQGMLVRSLGSSETVTGPLVHYKEGVTVASDAVFVMPAQPTPAAARAAAGAAMVISRETAADRAGWDAAAAKLPTSAARAVKLSAAAPRRATRVVLAEAAFDQLNGMADGTVVSLAFQTRQGSVSARSWNAVGRLPGRDPKLASQVIVLSAHLDHIGARQVAAGQDGINNGADDDASGTVAVLELARTLALGPRPARTLVFALFGSEEIGGFGAGYFVDLPVIPLANIVADLQFEMIGRPDPAVPPGTLWLTGFSRSTLGPELAKQGARLVDDPHPDQNFFQRSD
ncbi:MAG TPA: M20/M25/M40 family metallo-hydrolase, partial [Vicinamibacterales bacterium]|nr:M20/M25/M40 family metallo-hydrolase [Vicinamibacterales bacterium]